MADSYHPKLRSYCNVCGKCCTYSVILTKKEIQKIARLGYEEKDFVVQPFKWKEIKKIDSRCYFLKIDEKGHNHCAIYDSRPKPCIIYPDKDPNITRCPHFKRGFLLDKSSSSDSFLRNS